jgi:RNA polymerase sigma-70 factor (ECF subfamily)
MSEINETLAKLYRTDSASIIAVLTRLFGMHNYALVEDVLQEAFGKALVNWQSHSIPDNPSGWILTAAKNAAIDTIRTQKTRTKFAPDITELLESEWSVNSTIEHEFGQQNIKDDELRMLFVCCRDEISAENRIPFILQTLCGFSILAISRALLIPETTVKKRLLRTKEKLKHCSLEIPEKEQRLKALNSIHTIIYLLFNEGFYSSGKNAVTNIDFCSEAIRLIELLVSDPSLVIPDSLALLALMNFNLSRNAARLVNQPTLSTKERTSTGNEQSINDAPIPIDRQNRALWDQSKINKGNHYLSLVEHLKSNRLGRYYWEAKIAQLHCNSDSFENTNWARIVELYENLYEVTLSPMVSLNKAIAVAYAGNPTVAINDVLGLEKQKIFKSSHIPSATLAHLYAMLGKREMAFEFAEKSKSLGGTPIEQRILLEQLERLLD